MSRLYEMGVEISGYDPAKVPQIQAAAEQEWPIDGWHVSHGEGPNNHRMHGSAEASLCGGETEEEFAERFAVAVWRANGGYCQVVVDATYMEALPYETHVLDEDDYRRLLAGKELIHVQDQGVGDASG
jgi:hypothetical protein